MSDELIRRTENPRHRAILLDYRQHGLREISGRYEEFINPESMSDEPIYHMRSLVLRGMDEIRGFYQHLQRERAGVPARRRGRRDQLAGAADDTSLRDPESRHRRQVWNRRAHTPWNLEQV